MHAVLAAALVTAILVPATALASGEATFGTQNWSQTAREAKFQEFLEKPNGAWLESFLVQGPVGKFTATSWGTDLFLKQQAMGLSFDRGVRWQLDGSYRQVPHVFSLIARSPFTDLGGGRLALPDSLQRQNQDNAAGFNNRMGSYLDVAPFVPLEHRTDISKARLRFRPTEGWRLDLKTERQSKVGTKQYGMSFGFSNANEVWEPIHQRSTDVSATANYARDKVGFRALLGYSKFDNLIDALVVDNPRRAIDSPTSGSSVGVLDLYPDNRVIRGQVDLTLRLRKETNFSGTLAMAHNKQDDPWLPFTSNTAFSQTLLDSLYGGITARSTNARALRTTGNLRLTNRFSSDLRATGFFRIQHYENETEEFPFAGVVQYDQSLVRDTVGFHNHPYGNQQVSIGTDWDARLADDLSFSAGYTRYSREHTFREVEKDHEDELRARLFATVGEDVTVSAGYTFGARRLDEFHVSDYQRPDRPDTVYIENPGLRRFDVADRDRRRANAEIGWSPAERVDFGISGDYQKSEFKESLFGLQADERWTTMLEVGYRASDSWDLRVGYGIGRTDTDQASQERGSGEIPINDSNLTAGNEWTARLRDRNDFGFFQSTWKLVPSKVSISTSYLLSRDQGKYFFANETMSSVDLPETYSLRQEGHFEARYRMPGGTEIIGRYGYDTWKVEDFAAADIPLLGVTGSSATAIYLGAGLQGYTAHTVGLAFSRRF